MQKILLIHQFKIQHYRVSIYNYLSKYLAEKGYSLIVVSNGIDESNTHSIDFNYHQINLTATNLFAKINQLKPAAVIFFVNLKNIYLFPVLLYAKLRSIKAIYWGPSRDMQDKNDRIKNFLYSLEHWLADAILLYTKGVKQYIRPRFLHKTFVANNTLNTTLYDAIDNDRQGTLAKYGIKTKKNIIYMGRMQRRKRIGDLIQAFKKLDGTDIGVVLAGPDSEGVLDNLNEKNVYKIGPLYGEKAIEILQSCDVCCLPGAVGLSIVDAFYCGLPLVTEAVDHGPEIIYFKDGVNGFMVQKGDIEALTEKLNLLLSDNDLRTRFSKAARDEIESNGHISTMSEGFLSALNFVFNKD
jgi:glycosyltransferase involved in cell wall biosynthesis